MHFGPLKKKSKKSMILWAELYVKSLVEGGVSTSRHAGGCRASYAMFPAVRKAPMRASSVAVRGRCVERRAHALLQLPVRQCAKHMLVVPSSATGSWSRSSAVRVRNRPPYPVKRFINPKFGLGFRTVLDGGRGSGTGAPLGSGGGPAPGGGPPPFKTGKTGRIAGGGMVYRAGMAWNIFHCRI